MNVIAPSITAYKTIRDRIIALDTQIDEATLADTVEGLTDIHEVVAAVVRAALFDEALAKGLGGHIEVLEKRLSLITDRAAARRRIARDAMIEVEIKRIVAPDFTLSVRSGSPALVVIDEAAIPENYWLRREPRLNRLGLLEDLKLGRTVAGVQLSTPEPVLSVRVR